MNKKLNNSKYINTTELIKIMKNEKFDYVAYVMTQWHLHSLEAVLSYLKEKNGCNLKGIILILKSPNAGYLIKVDYFLKKNENAFYFVNKKSVLMQLFDCINSLFVYCNLSNYNKRNEKFYFLRPNGYTYENLAFLYRGVKKQKIIVCELDEGIGTYIQDDKSWLKTTQKEKKSNIEKFKSYIKYIESCILKKSKLKEKGLYLDCRLLIKDNKGSYIPNNEIIKCYKQSIKNYSKENQIDISRFNGNYVIINTQPNTKNYMNNIIECTNYLKEKGYKIIIKPHPREINNYDFLCDDKISVYKEPFSQESILSSINNKPRFIIGYYSTTLLTARIIYGIKTFSLDDMIVKYEQIEDMEKEIMFKFKSAFENIIKFCSKFEEIK